MIKLSEHSLQALHSRLHSGYRVPHSSSDFIRSENQLFTHNTAPPRHSRGNPRSYWETRPKHRVIAPVPPNSSGQLLGHSDYAKHAVGHAEQLTCHHNAAIPRPRGQQTQQHLIALPSMHTLPTLPAMRNTVRKCIGEGGKVLPVPCTAILRVCNALLGTLHTHKMSWMAGRQMHSVEL